MKLRITYAGPDLTVDEIIDGATADALVRVVQHRVAARAGFLLRIAINAMSPIQFAQEIVRRYNAASGSCLPVPATCDEFVERAIEAGIAHVVEETS